MKKFLKQKKQTAVKGRSSALLITIVVHVALFLIAGTFVAMEVIERQEAKFEAKQISRPKMKLKKLRVPVKFEKKMKQASPKLSARMTVNPVNVKSVDFKMPDTAGLGGSGGGGLAGAIGLAGNMGFSSTQIDLFGLKSSGEKMIFLLDAGGNMMGDDLGGIPAYTIIKKELLAIIDLMPPTALFNVLVFTDKECRALSPDMLPATDANLQRFKQWIMPLNAQNQNYGLSTLGSEGTAIAFEPLSPLFSSQDNWVAGLGYAARKGADVVYWLGNNEYMESIYDKYYRACKKGEPLPYKEGWPPEMPQATWDFSVCGGIDGWRASVANAQKIHDEENQRRLARGQPIKVNPTMSTQDHWLMTTYFPDEPRPEPTRPREGKEYWYTPEDLAGYIQAMSRKHSSAVPSASIGLKKKDLSFNVIHFVKIIEADDSNVRLNKLAPLAEELNGEYMKVGGKAAIR